MTLKRARVYSVSDGDGHFDQMDEYSERGEYYYAEDVDREIGQYRKALEMIRDGKIPQAMSPALFAEFVLRDPVPQRSDQP